MPVSIVTRIALVVGDFILLLVAVPVTLAIRVLSAPRESLVALHLLPFSILAVVFIAVFFSAGLYDPITTLMRRELPATIFGTQVVNVIIAALFFFFVPIFGIAPKTNLFIYLVVSVVFVSIWHFVIPSLSRGGGKERAVLVGGGEDAEALIEECRNGSCPFSIDALIPLADSSPEAVRKDIERALGDGASFVLGDFSDDRLPAIFSLLRKEAPLVNFTDIYEGIFRRVPLSSLSHQWLLEDANPERVFYSIIKRGIDIVFGIFLSLVLLVLIPFLWLAVRLDDGGPLFIRQKRMGRAGSTISVFKFRTMRENKAASKEWTIEEKKSNPVTNVGAFLRKTSLDELPQVLSVLMGELSLVGPRSDILGLAERLREAIPFYMLRYSVTPGISGWAQVNQRYSPGNISPQSLEESRIRLMYDLYYVKHRSPLLDLSIVLRTLKTLIARVLA